MDNKLSILIQLYILDFRVDVKIINIRTIQMCACVPIHFFYGARRRNALGTPGFTSKVFATVVWDFCQMGYRLLTKTYAAACLHWTSTELRLITQHYFLVQYREVEAV